MEILQLVAGGVFVVIGLHILWMLSLSYVLWKWRVEWLICLKQLLEAVIVGSKAGGGPDGPRSGS